MPNGILPDQTYVFSYLIKLKNKKKWKLLAVKIQIEVYSMAILKILLKAFIAEN